MEQNNLEVLLEDMRGKFDLVLEGHDALLRRMDRLADESKERDEDLLLEIRAVSKRVDRVEDRLVGVEERLERVETKVDVLGKELAAHRQDTEAHFGVAQVCDR